MSSRRRTSVGRLVLGRLLAALIVLAPAVAVSAVAPSWLALFKTRNGVSVNDTTGDVMLRGGPPAPGSLAPSAGLVTVDAYDGDLQINATISSYNIMQ
jgi:hypothetical protein